jgi:hypothetical protein
MTNNNSSIGKDNGESSTKKSKRIDIPKKIEDYSKFFDKKIKYWLEYTKYTGYKSIFKNYPPDISKCSLFQIILIIIWNLLFLTWLIPLIIAALLFCFKYLCIFGLYTGKIVSTFNAEKPDSLDSFFRGIYKFVAYLLCIPFTAETKKFGTLKKINDVNNNRNKNLEKKCGGWWIVWGSIMLGYLLISLMIGPGALIGLVILIPSLHFFTLKLNKSIEDFNKLQHKKLVLGNNTTIGNNTTNENGITRKELIKQTPFKKLINKFMLLIMCNIIITLILAAAV